MGTRSKKNKRVEITPRKLNEMKIDAMGQAFILSSAYLMDELDYDPEKIIDFWNGVCRYSEAIETKLITIHKVVDIINENTGLNVRWNGK